MYKIVTKKEVASNLKLFEIEAPLVARHAAPGQFIVLMVHEKGERIPLTIFDTDKEKGTVSILFQELGASTKKLGLLNEGDSIAHFFGPLGNPLDIKKYGTVVLVAGGLGIASIYHALKPMKEAGNKIVTIYGARNKDLLVMKDKLEAASDEFYMTTDDGSEGTKGVVTLKLEEILKNEKVDLVLAVGPVIMMKFVSKMTKEYGVKTLVDLNPIMIDGTGMCGGCRVRINGELKLVCVDGTAFDGHAVDFDHLMNKLKTYTKEEEAALKHNEANCPVGAHKKEDKGDK